MKLVLGTSTGQIQEVALNSLDFANHPPEVSYSLCQGTDLPGVALMTPQGENLVIARSNGAIEKFNTNTLALNTDEQVHFPFDSSEKIAYLFADSSVWALSSTGRLATVDPETAPKQLSILKKKKSRPLDSIQSASFFEGRLAVVGSGPLGSPTVFEISKSVDQPIFKAKPILNTKLNISFPEANHAVAFLGRDQVAVGTARGTVNVFDTASASLVCSRQVFERNNAVMAIYTTDKAGQVVLVDGQNTVELYDLLNGKGLGRFVGHEGAVQCLSIATLKRRRLLITAAQDRYLRIFDISTRKLLFRQFLKYIPTCLQIICDPDAAPDQSDSEDSEDEGLWEDMQIAPSDKRRKVTNN